jgi:hypothetical protein
MSHLHVDLGTSDEVASFSKVRTEVVGGRCLAPSLFDSSSSPLIVTLVLFLMPSHAPIVVTPSIENRVRQSEQELRNLELSSFLNPESYHHHGSWIMTSRIAHSAR